MPTRKGIEKEVYPGVLLKLIDDFMRSRFEIYFLKIYTRLCGRYKTLSAACCCQNFSKLFTYLPVTSDISAASDNSSLMQMKKMCVCVCGTDFECFVKIY